MGERILNLAGLALIGAILGDLLVHKAGTDSLFSGLGMLAGSTYRAAAGAYSVG